MMGMYENFGGKIQISVGLFQNLLTFKITEIYSWLRNPRCLKLSKMLENLFEINKICESQTSRQSFWTEKYKNETELSKLV